MRPQRLTALLLLATLFSQSLNAALEVHEWGTFTSLVGSDGRTQHGMYHEDEALPSFVHPFGFSQTLFPEISPFPGEFPYPGDNQPCMSKGCFSMNTLQQNVISQKMETPVIYFYGTPSTGKRVKVNVKFPDGVITETYPGPVASFPKKSTDFVAIKDGEVTFDVELLSDTSLYRVPYVDAKNIYIHARNTKSQLVRTNNELEKFIFYRGIGRFQPKISIGSNNGDLHLRSTVANQPQAAFLVSVSLGGKRHQMLPLNPTELSIPPSFSNETVGGILIDPKTIHSLTTQFPSSIPTVISEAATIRGSMNKALLNAGLYEDEANAMLNTWEHGYLKVPGLRLLYILPRTEVDQLLPLTITPQADRLNRAFIARIEIMTDKEENSILSDILRDGAQFDIGSLGRFAEPKLRRIQQVYNGKINTPHYSVATANIISDLVNKSVSFAETASTTL